MYSEGACIADHHDRRHYGLADLAKSILRQCNRTEYPCLVTKTRQNDVPVNLFENLGCLQITIEQRLDIGAHHRTTGRFRHPRAGVPGDPRGFRRIRPR